MPRWRIEWSQWLQTRDSFVYSDIVFEGTEEEADRRFGHEMKQLSYSLAYEYGVSSKYFPFPRYTYTPDELRCCIRIQGTSYCARLTCEGSVQ